MLTKHIYNKLLENFKFEPTEGQSVLFEHISELIANNNSNSALIIKGYAGTGKTTVVDTIIKTLALFKQKSVLLAPTGRAAKVLTSYTGKNAYTIHKEIYWKSNEKDGLGKFSIRFKKYTDTFFIIDEASMISDSSYENSIFGSGRLLDDLITYIKQGTRCKLILIGDIAQLPPVGLELSPALDRFNIETFGYSVNEIMLTQVIRQEKTSGILHNATKIREQLNQRLDYTPQLTNKDFDDVFFISGEELIDKINESYDKYGINETLVVTRTNKRANIFNQGIRNQIFWYEERITVGDILMIVKNNYHWLNPKNNKEIDFIANGDIAEVIRINNYKDLYNHSFADVTLKLVDYEIEFEAKIFLDTLEIETASLGSEKNKELFFAVLEDYQHIMGRSKQYEAVREDDYFNALQVKFAYGVTCHKAQGGQWKSVFIDHGYITDEMVNYEFLRWLYTAITRASKEVYLVNFKKEFKEKNY